MRISRKIALLGVAFIACMFGIAAVTQIDLTFQVKNILPIANGGTGVSTGAVTSIATTSPITGGTITATGTVACPTCATGPDTTITGGILGAQVVSVGSGLTYSWFAFQVNPGYGNFSSDTWISSLTATIAGTMAAGSYYSVGLTYYGGTTAYPDSHQFTIPGGSTAGAYQSSYPFPVFINSLARNGVNVTSVSPVNAVAAQMNFVTANVVGVNAQPLRWPTSSTTLAGSATAYAGPGQFAVAQATENLMVVPFPYAGTLSNLCLSTMGAQPSGGTLTVTTRYGATFGAIADTSQVATVPASGGTGIYCDYSHTVSVAAGGVMTWKLVNGSGSTGAQMNAISATFTPSSAGPTAMIVFPTGNRTLASGSALYQPAFSSNTGTTTEANWTAAMPRAGTAKNLYCYVTTSPGTNSDVLTVRQNLASPASGLTVTITTSTTGIISDTSHTISLANKDLIDLQNSQASGTNPAVSSCSMEID